MAARFIRFIGKDKVAKIAGPQPFRKSPQGLHSAFTYSQNASHDGWVSLPVGVSGLRRDFRLQGDNKSGAAGGGVFLDGLGFEADVAAVFFQAQDLQLFPGHPIPGGGGLGQPHEAQF